MNEYQFNEDFMKSYNEESEVYFLEVDIKYREELHVLHNDLPFLSERMEKSEKSEKLVANFHDKKEYVIHIRNLKQALNHGLFLKKSIDSLNLIKKFD